MIFYCWQCWIEICRFFSYAISGYRSSTLLIMSNTRTLMTGRYRVTKPLLTVSNNTVYQRRGIAMLVGRMLRGVLKIRYLVFGSAVGGGLTLQKVTDEKSKNSSSILFWTPFFEEFIKNIVLFFVEIWKLERQFTRHGLVKRFNPKRSKMERFLGFGIWNQGYCCR